MRRKTALLVLLLSVSSSGQALAGGTGWGAIAEGMADGLRDIEDRNRGDYAAIERRNREREYERWRREEEMRRWREEQRKEEELRLLREEIELIRQQNGW